MTTTTNTTDEAMDMLLRVGWSRHSIAVWLRAKGLCEYCDKDLLDCPDRHFFGSEIDHIVPDGSDGPNWDNHALSCKACNRIKRNTRFSDSEINLSRAQLIGKARDHVRLIRNRNEERLHKSIELLKACGLRR